MATSTRALPGDDDKGPAILGAITTTTVLAIIFVVTRLYARIRVVRAVGPDDYFVVAALVCSIVAFGVNIPDIRLGAGRHAAFITPATNIPKGLKLNFVTQPFLLVGTTLVKVSIGFFLHRIAGNKWYKRAILSVNIFLLVITTFFMLTLFVQCRPLAAVWDFTLRPTAKCWDSGLLQRLSYTNTSINVVVDFAFAALPIPMLWNVQINNRTKAALVGIMGLGVFAGIAGIMKITTIGSYGRTNDFLYDSTGLTIWTTTELNVGIIAACVPCLKPLFKALLHSSGYRSTSKNKPNTRTYALQGSGKATKDASRAAERGESYQMQSYKSEIGSNTRKVYPDNVSEDSLLAFEGTGIVKTMQVDISSNKHQGDNKITGKDNEIVTKPWERP